MTAQTTIEKIFSTMRIFSPWDFAKAGTATTRAAPYSADIAAVWDMINTNTTGKMYPNDPMTHKVTVHSPGIKAVKYSLYKEFLNRDGVTILGWVRCHGYDGQTLSDVAEATTLAAANAAFKAGMDVSGYINKDFAEEVFEEGCDTIMPVKTTNNFGAKNSNFVVTLNHATLLKVKTAYSVEDGVCKLTIKDDRVSTEEDARLVAEAVDAYCDNFAVISRSV